MPTDAPDPRLHAFGIAIRRTRENADMSIDKLADESGLSSRMLIGIEHGRRNPSLLTILAIARGLNIDPGDLVNAAGR